MHNVEISIYHFHIFAKWLETHIREMLNISGFELAYWYESEEYNSKEKILWVVQFQISNRDALQRYLDNFAQNMRQKGIHIFQGSFKTKRRILQLRQKYGSDK